MALTKKTPGVFVEEISKFPPSIAEVATAIPAFIGYTAIAKAKTNGDLHLVPTRITSLLEYETYFGTAQNEEGITVDVLADGTIVVNRPSDNDKSPFLMYYSMQMFFANGGGPCYITSVGQYVTAEDPADVVTGVTRSELEKGLAEIKKQDEPTLLLFPDVTSLVSSDLNALYTLALDQCVELQDRFVIMETRTDESTSVDNLRNGLPSEENRLKYGAVYYPFLQTILNYQYLDADVNVSDAVTPTSKAQVTTIKNSITTTALDDLIDQLEAKRAAVNALTGAGEDAAAEAEIAPVTALATDIVAEMKGLETKLGSIPSIVNLAISQNPTLDAEDLEDASDAVTVWKDTYLSTTISPIEGYVQTLAGLNTKVAILAQIDNIIGKLKIGGTRLDVRVGTLIANPGLLQTVITELTDFVNATLAGYKLTNNAMYNRIKAELSRVGLILPPAASVAGIYARVDAANGVWTAPANASISYVTGPSRFIDNQVQDNLNVSTTGKSVNAIRSFTGRGTLVWGARTLAGNSNEWRYVPVRRFFNMVEESARKATEQFVFQGNNANTWVKIKGMIEAYLTQQWKAGALTGAKPEQAFYVSVGLGQTMTAQDILEGKMIIQIGMAVVRPAEFIVLEFSHKMQEA